MSIQEEIEKLGNLKKLLEINSYELSGVGINAIKELKDRIIENLGVSSDSYVYGDDYNNVLVYLKQMCSGNNIIDEMPLQLKVAVEAYCCDNYNDINNEFLRKNKGLKRETSDKCSHIIDYSTFKTVDYYKEGIVDALDIVINQNELDKGVILYRGCTNIGQFSSLGITSPEELFLAIGKSFVEYGYTSTTPSLDGRFVDESSIIMIIKAEPGVHVANFIDTKLSLGEGEILLERGIEFTVTKVEIVNGKFYVYTDARVKELKKVPSIDDIKLADNEKDISLIKNGYDNEEDILLDFDFIDDFEIGIKSR